MYDVVTFGSAVLDVMVKSRDFRVLKSHQVKGGVALCEVYGGKSEVDDIGVMVGGGATNAGVSFVRKGLKTGAIFKIGEDEVGGLIGSGLEKEKLSMELAVVDKEGKSAMSVVLVSGDGGRSILTYRGVSRELESREVPWKKLSAKWFYVSSLGGRMDLLEDIVFFAKEKGVKVAVNPGKAELAQKEKLGKLLGRVELLLLNRMEVAELLGVGFEEDKKIVGRLTKLGPKIVAMSEGRRGASVLTAGKRVGAGVFRVKTVDETGAGDAFGSGLVYGLMQYPGLADALKVAMANAAGVVGEVGAKKGLLDKTEVAKWMKKNLEITEEKI